MLQFCRAIGRSTSVALSGGDSIAARSFFVNLAVVRSGTQAIGSFLRAWSASIHGTGRLRATGGLVAGLSRRTMIGHCVSRIAVRPRNAGPDRTICGKERPMTADGRRYHQTYRRTLLDMHIPDWDAEFLSEYEPEKLADLYASSNISGVLFYCKSHMGLNYWPAPVGGVHPAAKTGTLSARC